VIYDWAAERMAAALDEAKFRQWRDDLFRPTIGQRDPDAVTQQEIDEENALFAAAQGSISA